MEKIKTWGGIHWEGRQYVRKEGEEFLPTGFLFPSKEKSYVEKWSLLISGNLEANHIFWRLWVLCSLIPLCSFPALPAVWESKPSHRVVQSDRQTSVWSSSPSKYFAIRQKQTEAFSGKTRSTNYTPTSTSTFTSTSTSTLTSTSTSTSTSITSCSTFSSVNCSSKTALTFVASSVP